MTLGAAISELLRKAENAPEPNVARSGKLKESPQGFLVIAKRGKVITPEMVKEASEDDLV